MDSDARDLTISTLADRPDLEDAMWELGDLWPAFLLNDPTADLYYARCVRLFSDLVLVAEDPRRPGVVVARGFAIPFAAGDDPFPADGWDAVIRRGMEDVLDRRETNHVSALEITLRPDYRGAGLAGRMIRAMKEGAVRRGADGVVAPVRPTGKSAVPWDSMEDYVGRRRADGLPADAWLRSHARVGGTIVGVAPRSMTIVASLDDWRRWTGLAFDRSGDHVVDGALVPVHVDVERDQAIYVEPNVWVSHPL